MEESAAFLCSPLATAMAGLFGSLCGSFFNVCIDRVPLGKSIAFPGSHCASCGAPVRPLDNIPILSYFILRGRCRTCRARFSARHAVVEVLVGLLVAALWWKVVASEPDQVLGVRLARFAVYLAFSGVLVVLSFIDLATQRLPDVITLPAIPILFLSAFGAHDVPWKERLIGAVAGYLVLRIVADFYYYVLKREALGLGDAKLLALIGAVLGWRSLPFVVFVGGFVGAVVSMPIALQSRRRGRVEATGEPIALRHVLVPFGPFLAAAALLYLFAGATLFRLWLG